MRFLTWQEIHGLVRNVGDKQGQEETRGLTRFVRALARDLSGEAVVSNTRSLLKTLRNHISTRQENRIREMLPVWRRDANKMHPPGRQAAEAVSLHTLKRLVKGAREVQLSKRERQALDIFVVAFESMSRVAEIANLCVDEVTPDGRTITIRPKTGASTWLRLTKRLSASGVLNAAERIAHYRERAERRGTRNLFEGTKGRPPETASITSLLGRLGKKLGLEARITSHSARKGAAVEALKAGVPLPIIQALGAWKDANSMQAYIGEAVRRSTALMDLLKGRHTGENTSRAPRRKGGGRQEGEKGSYDRTTSTRTWN